MSRFVTPGEVAPLVAKCLADEPWYRGVRIVGIGRDAVLEVVVTDMVQADRALSTLGGKVAGYPIRTRRISDQ